MTATPEQLIDTLALASTELEEAQGALEVAVREYAEAENAYRLARARGYLTAAGATVAEREARVDADTGDERFRAHLSEGVMKAALESVRNRRQQLSAWQTAASLVKSELDLAKYGPEVAA